MAAYQHDLKLQWPAQAQILTFTNHWPNKKLGEMDHLIII